MRNVKKILTAMAVLAMAGVLGACGSSSVTATEEGEIVSGKLSPLADAPPAYSGVSGEADLTRTEGDTVVSLSAAGLEPNTAYIAHLHTGGCDQPDPGGPHFQFEPGGSEEPPNEIHLEFTSDAKGDAEAQARSKREAPVGEAGSVVLHKAESHDGMTADDATHSESTMVLFVHEGVDHSKEGGDHGGKPEQAHSDKIACAELEGASAPAEGGGPTAGGDVPTIVVRGGEPVGGVETIEVNAGDDIRFKVTSDQAEEIHVHGYDIAQNVPAGGTVEFNFPADLEGIYEIELEKLAAQIAELQVNP